jgi:hypothetical protein
MAKAGRTPEEFGFRVRSHPDILRVTNPRKLITGTKLKLSYSGAISETIVFHKDTDVAKRNRETFERFLSPLSRRIAKGKPYVWSGIDGETICEVLDSLTSHPASTKASARMMSNYIKAQLGQAEVTDWTVKLVNADNKEDQVVTLAGMKVRLTKRAFPEDENDPASDRYVIRRLVSPADEETGLDQEGLDLALSDTIADFRADPSRYKDPTKEPDRASGRRIRGRRGAKNGLLLLYPIIPPPGKSWEELPMIGFAISFPESENAKEIEYVVNTTYFKDEYGWDESEA